MEDSLEVGVEVREEVMVPPTGDGIPTKKQAHFLKPTINSTDGSIFEIPSCCLADLPATFEPKRWPLKMSMNGWMSRQNDWKPWVEKMAALHECTWKKAGILEAILNSTYKIHRSNNNLILGLAERWCPETKSFIFSWGEATITLEDVMIAGYSVLGFPVFNPLETDELKKLEEKMNQARTELNKSTSKKADHSQWMKKFMDNGSEIEHEAFLALWLSRYVFPGPHSVVVKSVFPVAVHLARGTRIALAPAILACIYRELSLLKEKIVALTKIDSWGDEDSLAINIRSPFQLVQIWAWERFLLLRPEPNLIKAGEPRFALWHEKTVVLEDVRTVLDSAQEDFDWRPYVKPVKNFIIPKFYGEKGMWVSVEPNLSEELQSFAQCLRISELVGPDCIEQYLPHRVAMQFGMDQDIPTCVARSNETPYIAWNCYSKPIDYTMYIASRFDEGDVTTRYFDWWKQSMSHLKETVGRNYMKRFEVTPGRFDGLKKLDGASTHSSVSLKSLENPLEISKGKNKDINASAVSGGILKNAKKSVKTSKGKNRVSAVSAAFKKPSEKLEPYLIVKMEANDSLVPPGFPPKSNVVEPIESTEDDNMTITKLFKFSKKLDDAGNIEENNGENLLPSQSQQFSSSTAHNEAVNIIELQAQLAEKIIQNEPVKAGAEAAREHASASEAGSPDHDGVRIQEGELDETRNAVEISAMQLEDRVSKLEKIIAQLKAARFGHK